MPDIREEFEAWLLPEWSREKFVDGDGDIQYIEDWVQGAWIGWQASRAALRVELPDNSARAGSDPYQDGYYACREEVEEALQQAGIEVKYG